jgi:acetyl-CoA carboxylase biotin carboxylase subunit
VHRPAGRARQLSQHSPDLAACEITGADAVHPGYGFLSENAVRRNPGSAQHNLHRPDLRTHSIMGDKIEAKQTAARLGIPVVPGSEGGVTNRSRGDEDRRRYRLSGAGQGAAGGGGRGMKVARSEDDLVKPFKAARSRSKGGLRRRRCLHGKIPRPSRAISRCRWSATARAAIHLGERDCSLQRRHQKVLGGGPLPCPERQNSARNR